MGVLYLLGENCGSSSQPWGRSYFLLKLKRNPDLFNKEGKYALVFLWKFWINLLILSFVIRQVPTIQSLFAISSHYVLMCHNSNVVGGEKQAISKRLNIPIHYHGSELNVDEHHSFLGVIIYMRARMLSFQLMWPFKASEHCWVIVMI